MKQTAVKAIAFLVVLIFLLLANLEVFRSDLPYLAFITIIGSVIFLIYFPYNKFFKNN